MHQPLATTAARSSAREEKLRQLRGLIAAGAIESKADRSESSFDGLIGEVAPGRLVDLLAPSRGCGEAVVALWIAMRACQQRGQLVVVDQMGAFYPPAAVAWGVDAARLLVVKPPSTREAISVTEAALRSPAVSAVWATLGRISVRPFRRLLLAAETGNAFGVFVRPGYCEVDPSWADVQMVLSGIPSPGLTDEPFLVRVCRRRNRHGPAGGSAVLSIDWRTGKINDVTNDHGKRTGNSHPLPVATGLADSANKT